MSIIEQKCKENGIKITSQRRLIAKILCSSTNHPTVDELYQKTKAKDDSISMATIYRTMKMFEEAGIVEKHDFASSGVARYEISSDDEHHDHMIDVNSGEIIEFVNEEIELLQEKIANQYGYELVDHKLELYVRKKSQ